MTDKFVFHVNKDDVCCEEEDIKDYVDLLNGISYACGNGAFKSGHRNQIVLDLTVASYKLGLDAIDVLAKFVERVLIDEHNDDEDTWDRVSRALEYHNRFSWQYMIDPEDFCKLKNDYIVDDLRVQFVLD